MPLRCYGENSATFLIFDALVRDEKLMCLLETLRAAGNGERFTTALDLQQEADVWLFPNFGKRHGFGEPDALVLVGEHCFWFEVESRIDLGRGSASAVSAIRQVARFHLFCEAVSNGVEMRSQGQKHLAIIGPTISDSGDVKLGILRLKGHPVLRRVRKRLTTATHHLVLMSIQQATGPGGDIAFSAKLSQLVEAEFDSIGEELTAWAERHGYPGPIPRMPKPEDVWYTYWNGNASSKCYEAEDDPLNEGGYIPTRPSR